LLKCKLLNSSYRNIWIYIWWILLLLFLFPQVGSLVWQYMSQRMGPVWSTSRAPTGPLRFRLVVTGGYDGKWVWTEEEVLPADWEIGELYDAKVKIKDIAQESCCPDNSYRERWRWFNDNRRHTNREARNKFGLWDFFFLFSQKGWDLLRTFLNYMILQNETYHILLIWNWKGVGQMGKKNEKEYEWYIPCS
jgi:Expansin C-terminal domain